MGLPRNFSNGGKSRFMTPYILRATGQWCSGDFHTVGNYLDHVEMVVAFVPFPVNTDVLPISPSFLFKKRKKKSVPVGDTLSQRKLPLAALCLPAGGTWTRTGPLELCL